MMGMMMRMIVMMMIMMVMIVGKISRGSNRIGSGGAPNVTGRIGSSQEVCKYQAQGRPTPTRSDTTPEKPWISACILVPYRNRIASSSKRSICPLELQRLRASKKVT